MELVALKPIGHSVGTIAVGQKFHAGAAEAEQLILTGQAVTPKKMVWGGIRWPGETVVIMASGPSMTLADAERVREWRESGEGRRAVVVNTTFMLAPWADVLYACDAPWWKVYYAEARRTSTAEFWTQDRAAVHDGLHHVESRAGAGLGKWPGVINQGRNGGYQAANLAFHAGARRIILMGFDMDGGHWHGEHPKPLTNIPAYLFDLWVKAFEPLAADLKAEGVEVLNCSRATRLTCFKRVALEAALA